MNFLRTSECLQGWTVSVLTPVKGWGYQVTVWLMYQLMISSKISFVVNGFPSTLLPEIHILGEWQQSSQVMLILYLLKSDIFGSGYYLREGTTYPSTMFSLISSFIMSLILTLEVASEERNCFLGSVREDLVLVRDPSHLHPKLVSWFPASTNISGVRSPLFSKSSALTVILDSTNLETPQNNFFIMIMIGYVGI